MGGACVIRPATREAPLHVASVRPSQTVARPRLKIRFARWSTPSLDCRGRRSRPCVARCRPTELCMRTAPPLLTQAAKRPLSSGFPSSSDNIDLRRRLQARVATLWPADCVRREGIEPPTRWLESRDQACVAIRFAAGQRRYADSLILACDPSTCVELRHKRRPKRQIDHVLRPEVAGGTRITIGSAAATPSCRNSPLGASVCKAGAWPQGHRLYRAPRTASGAEMGDVALDQGDRRAGRGRRFPRLAGRHPRRTRVAADGR
jgi:hypothetical protein